MILMLSRIQVKENLLQEDKYRFLFSVEEVNRRVLEGMPFRDAYRQVGQEIEAGEYNPARTVTHTHEGSIGNLSNDKIKAHFEDIRRRFDFQRIDDAIRNLLGLA